MLDIHPTGGPLGAKVHGLDLRKPLEDSTIGRLKDVFYEYGVLVFSGQDLTEEDQVRFTRYFCEPVPHPTNTRNRGTCPEITLISNLEVNGAPIGSLGNAEVHFHKDLAFTHTPGTISVLYAVEVPDEGGDTSWANGYAAYEALDEALKAQIEGLKIVTHHARPENPAVWPIVTTHPETGRRVLNISPNHDRLIEGLNEAESRALLDRLIAHASHPRFVWTHRWHSGDLVMWDNRCTMHRRDPFDNRQRRLMKICLSLGHLTTSMSSPPSTAKKPPSTICLTTSRSETPKAKNRSSAYSMGSLLWRIDCLKNWKRVTWWTTSML